MEHQHHLRCNFLRHCHVLRVCQHNVKADKRTLHRNERSHVLGRRCTDGACQRTGKSVLTQLAHVADDDVSLGKRARRAEGKLRLVREEDVRIIFLASVEVRVQRSGIHLDPRTDDTRDTVLCRPLVPLASLRLRHTDTTHAVACVCKHGVTHPIGCVVARCKDHRPTGQWNVTHAPLQHQTGEDNLQEFRGLHELVEQDDLRLAVANLEQGRHVVLKFMGGMVGDSHTHVHHVLARAIDVDVVVLVIGEVITDLAPLVAVVLGNHPQERCLATPRFGLDHDSEFGGDKRNHRPQFFDGDGVNEIDLAHGVLLLLGMLYLIVGLLLLRTHGLVES